MKVLLLLISIFTTIYLSGCAGCSNSERKGRHSKNNKERQTLPVVVDTLNLDSTVRKTNIEEIGQLDITSQDMPSFKVIGIIDGDTYDILDGRKVIRVRMDGIDAPEKGMPYNKVSKKYLSDLIFDKIIQVKMGEIDKYGRTIAQTYLLDGTDVSLEMIRAGLAWHFKKYSSNEQYSKTEVDARENKLGLWKESNPISPWEVRMLHRNGVSTKELFKDSPK